jgi:hypothetical protein
MNAGEVAEVKRISTTHWITMLATSRPRVAVQIGSRWTGRREYHWDSRSGVYSECKPDPGLFEAMLQKALLANKTTPLGLLAVVPAPRHASIRNHK